MSDPTGQLTPEFLESLHAAVLVEGESDKAALMALATRLERDLPSEGVAVVAMGGATNIRRFVAALGPPGRGVPLAGLCDFAECSYFRSALVAAGLDVESGDRGLEAHGFFVCVQDLEDELIRAHGPDAVGHLVDTQGELDAFRTFQRQPAQRDRPLDAQLHRFIGTKSGRKVRYGRLLVEALDVDLMPLPLRSVLDRV